VGNKCLQVNGVRYLGCEISFKNEKGVQQKQTKFAQNAGKYKQHF
jgi:hypothetical protein